MKYEDYASAAHHGSDLVERGDFEGAIAIFRALVESDLSGPDKVMMCVNIAIVCQKMGSADEALAWYAAGVDIESPYCGKFALEQRASYLAEIGRNRESLDQYQQLLGHPALSEADKERLRRNIGILRGRTAAHE